MKIVIEKQKISDYLLVWKQKNDKSKFLNDLGYSLQNWEELKDDIEKIVLENQRIFQNAAPFGGNLYQVNGNLRNFGVITIWLLAENNDTFRFVTLYPDKKNL